MKNQLSGPDIRYLITEMQSLIGSRITRIKQYGTRFGIETYKTGPGAQHLTIAQPKWMWLTTTKLASGTSGPFCLYLRKHIEGGKILSIHQPGLERIVMIAISTKEDRYTLVVELFSGGNLLVLDHDYIIRGVLTAQQFKDRTLERGETYKLPPACIDATTLSLEEIRTIITSSKRDTISQTLAIDLGLGGSWAQEICARAHINPKTTNADPEVIHSAITSAFTSPLEPYLIFTDEELTDCTPIRFTHYTNAPTRTLTTFSEGIAILQHATSAPKTTAIDNQITAAQTIIDKQNEHRNALILEAADATRKGELIYEHYQEIKSIIDGIFEARKQMTWHEIKTKLKNKKVVEINEAKGAITLEL